MKIYKSPKWFLALVMGVYIMSITYDRIEYVQMSMRESQDKIHSHIDADQ
jgi:hypothetical protein